MEDKMDDPGKKQNVNEITEEYLTTVSNEAELSIIESILRSENILYILRHKGAGGIIAVYTGYSNFGADIYVSSEDVERAKAAIYTNTGLED